MSQDDILAEDVQRLVKAAIDFDVAEYAFNCAKQHLETGKSLFAPNVIAFVNGVKDIVKTCPADKHVQREMGLLLSCNDLFTSHDRSLSWSSNYEFVVKFMDYDFSDFTIVADGTDAPNMISIDLACGQYKFWIILHSLDVLTNPESVVLLFKTEWTLRLAQLFEDEHRRQIQTLKARYEVLEMPHVTLTDRHKG